jgi:hypothetical protein
MILQGQEQVEIGRLMAGGQPDTISTKPGVVVCTFDPRLWSDSSRQKREILFEK